MSQGRERRKGSTFRGGKKKEKIRRRRADNQKLVIPEVTKKQKGPPLKKKKKRRMEKGQTSTDRSGRGVIILIQPRELRPIYQKLDRSEGP